MACSPHPTSGPESRGSILCQHEDVTLYFCSLEHIKVILPDLNVRVRPAEAEREHVCTSGLEQVHVWPLEPGVHVGSAASRSSGVPRREEAHTQVPLPRSSGGFTRVSSVISLHG